MQCITGVLNFADVVKMGANVSLSFVIEKILEDASSGVMK